MPCPDDSELQVFSAGGLSEEQCASMLAHLETCDDCLSTVEELSRDAGLSRLRSVHAVTIELFGERAFREAEARLQHVSVCETGETESPPAAIVPSWRIGRYRLLEPIGSGGMGTVFKAVHTELGKTVAVKLLPPHRLGHAGAVDRFRREMQALGRFCHRHVVSATDGGEEGGHFYLAMEYVEGVDLSSLVDRVGPLPVADACELIRQAALGVEAIHRHGLVHRDLKPSNIMLTREGTVKVLDLGLSQFVAPWDEDGALTDTGQLLGTRAYMAPEQFESSRADARTDLYSLGATLRSLLCGGRPPSGSTGEEARDVPPRDSGRPPAQRDDVPRELAAIVERLTARDPSARFASAGELIAALRPLCEGSDLRALAERAIAGRRETADRARDAGTAPLEQAPRPGPRRSPFSGVWSWPTILAALTGAAAALTIIIIVINRQDAPDGASKITADPHEQSVERHESPLLLATDRAVAEWVLSRGGLVKPHHHREAANVADLPRRGLLIQSVNFYGVSELRDQDLESLAALRQLHELNLSRTPVTDEAAGALGRLTSLRFLYLSYTGVSDRSLRSLASLPNLSTLLLKGTKVTDEGMPFIAGLSNVVYLDLSDTQLTDEGLAKLASLPAINVLLLRNTAVTGEGLRDFTRLAELKTLDLSQTHITDEQLPILKTAAGLETLILSETAVSRDGLARLRRALPNCHITE